MHKNYLKNFIKNIFFPVLKKKPDFIIIGAQKAGTTSLYKYLIQHPLIMPNKTWKEIQYFDRIENYKKGFGWYLGNFPNKIGAKDKITCESSPDYLFSKCAPKRIKKSLGEIKLIMILRDPVERAYSAWTMYHSYHNNEFIHLKKQYDKRSLKEAILDEINDPNASRNTPCYYIARGIYVDQIKNYLRYFNIKSILILDFFDLANNLDLLLNKTCDFIGIERFGKNAIDEFSKQKFNANKYLDILDKDETFDKLCDYFLPYNRQLYNFLGYSFKW